MSFTIVQPSGAPLTAYEQGSGPHNGVDLVIVRSDGSHLLYGDTDIGAGGKITQPVVFPAPGRYRIVIDAYPKQTSAELPFSCSPGSRSPAASTASRCLRSRRSRACAATASRVRGRSRCMRCNRASSPSESLPDGRPAVFTPWRGALAHAIFIRDGSLDYFHTHVCGPGATNCAARLGGSSVTGRSSTPGVLKVGVLVPVPGTWRLFLLTYLDGRQLTTPFTLRVV